MAAFSHRPVLLEECVEALDIKPGGIYVDGTLGGGGHSEAICERLRGGRLIGIDRDETAQRVQIETNAALAALVGLPGDAAPLADLARGLVSRTC